MRDCNPKPLSLVHPDFRGASARPGANLDVIYRLISEISSGGDYNSLKSETNESSSSARQRRIGCDPDPDSAPVY